MIHVKTELEPPPVEAEVIQRAGSAVLKHESKQAEVTVVLTDDRQLRELNRQYRGTDAATDVLSFPAGEVNPETKRAYLGDVLISIPRAKVQAGAAGHPLEAELQLLVVHGVLHLLGYDHAGAEERARMWSAQSEVLQGLGLAGIKISEK